VENWFDIFPSVPRRQLGQIAPQMGRQFAYKIQSFLHEHGDITLGRMEIVVPRPNVSTDRLMVRFSHFEEATDLPDWPMPGNIKNFHEISRFVLLF
jgi:hypothetical protein